MRDSGGFELGPVYGGEVQAEAPVAGAAQELPREVRGDLAADLVTAGADRGAEVRAQGGGRLAELRERGDSLGGGVPGRASPTGVDGGDGTDAGEEDRDAVGRLDDEGDAGEIRRQDVALSRVAHLVPSGRITDEHGARAVNLCRSHDWEPVGREGAREAPREERGRGSLLPGGGAAAGEAGEEAGRRIGRPEDPAAVAFLLEPALSVHGGIVGAINGSIATSAVLTPSLSRSERRKC